MMHSSIETGVLAHIVGSKVMDMRTFSKIDRGGEANIDSRQASIVQIHHLHVKGNSSSNSAEIDGVRGGTDSPAYDSLLLFYLLLAHPIVVHQPKGKKLMAWNMMQGVTLIFLLCLSQICLAIEQDKSKHSTQWKLRCEDERMHSFESNNNIDLIVESNSEPTAIVSYHRSEIEMVCCDNHEPKLGYLNVGYEKELVNGLRISDALQTSFMQTSATAYGGLPACEDRVSEWIWTLHCLVVDTARTDSHLEFYEDKRNLTRMCDILAVYAWVDPPTSYCQA